MTELKVTFDERAERISSLRSSLMQGTQSDFIEPSNADESTGLVDISINAKFDILGKDMIFDVQCQVLDEDTEMIEVWIQNISEDLWIPQWHPWVASLGYPKANGGGKYYRHKLADSKWIGIEAGAEYQCIVDVLLWTATGTRRASKVHRYKFPGNT